MPTPHADKLIARARSGERLTATERRHCLAYMQHSHPDNSTMELAELFKVSDRQIRDDRNIIRTEYAKQIKKEDVGLVIADIRMALEQQIRNVESSLRKCQLGTRTYLEHCKTIMAMRLQSVEALQKLGYYPLNLGNSTVERFDYVAIVDERTGAVDTRSVEFADIIDAEYEEQKQLPAPEANT